MSYTAEHPVSWSRECAAHKVTVSTDNPTEGLVAIWNAMHANCEKEDGGE